MKRTGGKMNMNVKKNYALALAAAIVAAAGLALPVQAQVAPNYQQNGHLLDRNPQMGSGGTNSPVAGYVPATGNEIITGNVSGLARFHGSVPYRSEYEVGSVGNSSVSNFDRQSAGVPNYGTYTGQNGAYYNPSLLVATPNGVSGAQLRQPGVGSGVEATVARTSAYGDRLNIQQIGAPVSFEPAPSAGSQGQTPRINADPAANPFDPGSQISPLFGLQRDLRADAPENRFQNYAQPTTMPGTGAANGQINGQTKPNNGLEPLPDGKTTEVRTDLGVGSKVDANVTGSTPVGALDERVRGGAANQQVGVTNQQLIVSDEYKDLLAQLQKQRDAEQTKLAAATPATRPATGGPEFVIDPFTGELRVRNASDKTGGSTTQPGVRGTGKQQTTDATPALKAARSMPPLESLAGKGSTPFNTVMAAAEVRLKNGKYFEAADLYQDAMNQQPSNMLPVIGRAHAELGGGMYESAAYDLRFLFERKPEMMGLRYNLRALIPQERLDYLADDLDKLSKDKKSETAYFLLSYLQYQQGQKAELDKSLTAWLDARPKDNWPVAMRHAWLDGKPDDAKPDAKPESNVQK